MFGVSRNTFTFTFNVCGDDTDHCIIFPGGERYIVMGEQVQALYYMLGSNGEYIERMRIETEGKWVWFYFQDEDLSEFFKGIVYWLSSFACFRMEYCRNGEMNGKFVDEVVDMGWKYSKIYNEEMRRLTQF